MNPHILHIIEGTFSLDVAKMASILTIRSDLRNTAAVDIRIHLCALLVDSYTTSTFAKRGFSQN